MAANLGRVVLSVKDDKSCDDSASFSETKGMAERMSETEERLAFIARTRAAREARFETQKPMITILGIDQGTYKQYEIRTPLPHRHIPKFCAACGVTMEWLLTGEGKGPAVMPFPTKRMRSKAPKTIKRQVA